MRQSDFARLAGVSRASIAKAVRRGRLIEARLGDRINLCHDAALAYLADHPLPRDSNGRIELTVVPDGLWRPDLVRRCGQTPHLPSDLRFRILLTRTLGRIPSAQDLATHAFLENGGAITVTRITPC